MDISLIIMILFSHFVCDFILQDTKAAENKHKSITYLLNHTIIYSLAMLLFLLIFMYYNLVSSKFVLINSEFFGTKDLWIDSFIFKMLHFFSITFITHTVIDYITSKEVKKLFDKKVYGTSIPNLGGFTLIGFDQFLHFSQLFLTIYYLFYDKN